MQLQLWIGKNLRFDFGDPKTGQIDRMIRIPVDPLVDDNRGCDTDENCNHRHDSNPGRSTPLLNAIVFRRCVQCGFGNAFAVVEGLPHGSRLSSNVCDIKRTIGPLDACVISVEPPKGRAVSLTGCSLNADCADCAEPKPSAAWWPKPLSLSTI